MYHSGEGTSGRVEYIEAIEDLFVVIRKQGLMLSPADRDCAGRWFENGIPLRIAAQSILDQIESWTESRSQPIPHSLLYFHSGVEQAWKSVQENTFAPVEAEDSPSEDCTLRWLTQLERAGKATSEPRVRSGYRTLYKRLIHWQKTRQTTGLVHWPKMAQTLNQSLIEALSEDLTKDEVLQIEERVHKAYETRKKGLGAKARVALREALFSEVIVDFFNLFLLGDEGANSETP